VLEAHYWEELERMAREPVSEDELARAKALTEADELGALQRVDEKADRLSMYATLFDDAGMVNSILDRYLATTAEQIQAVCRDVFKPENRYVLTYLPAGAEASDAAGAEKAAETAE
jgi:predicted Zn-dependent peptidase